MITYIALEKRLCEVCDRHTKNDFATINYNITALYYNIIVYWWLHNYIDKDCFVPVTK